MDYYVDNAEQFYNETVGLDMSAQYERFIRWLPSGGAYPGCGLRLRPGYVGLCAPRLPGHRL